jgi:soluble lytic murein transglycosylase-like protein
MRKWLAKQIRRIPDRAIYLTGCAIGSICELVAAGFCLGVGFTLAVVLLLSWFGIAHAETIPAAALKYRSEVIRAARCEAGFDSPVAVFAAQLEQESGWNPEAVSPVGALGLGQFMPATARDMGRTRPDLGPAMPTNPGWAIRALVAYDLANLRRVRAATVANAWAMALAAYNGGLGWVYRDQALAKRQGLDPATWWGSVETVNAGRTKAAHDENFKYPRAILLKRQPKYLAWGPGIICEEAR